MEQIKSYSALIERLLENIKSRPVTHLRYPVAEFFERIYANRWDDQPNPKDKWDGIRHLYQENLPEIMERQKISRSAWADPYFLDWNRIFSPIEQMVWCAIRTEGPVVLYPQFPVDNVFIDFANPYLKIGLEVDGKAYHNKAKDQLRDQALAQKGWRIFRVTGAECHRDYDDTASLESYSAEREALEHYIYNTSDGVIRAIRAVYFTGISERSYLFSSFATYIVHTTLILYRNL